MGDGSGSLFNGGGGGGSMDAFGGTGGYKGTVNLGGGGKPGSSAEPELDLQAGKPQDYFADNESAPQGLPQVMANPFFSAGSDPDKDAKAMRGRNQNLNQMLDQYLGRYSK